MQNRGPVMNKFSPWNIVWLFVCLLFGLAVSWVILSFSIGGSFLVSVLLLPPAILTTYSACVYWAAKNGKDPISKRNEELATENTDLRGRVLDYQSVISDLRRQIASNENAAPRLKRGEIEILQFFRNMDSGDQEEMIAFAQIKSELRARKISL